MRTANTKIVLSAVEVKEIERGLYTRLTAAPTAEAQTDLVDFSTRNLQRLLRSYKELQARV